MNRFKKLLTCFLAFCLFCVALPFANAMSCCSLHINDVYQTDEGIVVNYTVTTAQESREFYIQLDSYVAMVDQPSGTYTHTIPVKNLLDGYTYRVSMSSDDYCPSTSCDYLSAYKDIVVEGDIPLFAIDELEDGKLALEGKSVAGVSVKAKDAGFYSIYAEGEQVDNIRISSYPNGAGVRQYEYYEKDTEKVFLISTWNESDLSTVIRFGKIQETALEPKTEDPTDGDICFTATTNNTLYSFEVLKEGVYGFDMHKNAASRAVNTDESGRFYLMRSNGNYLTNEYAGEMIECYLAPGTYYMDTYSVNDGYSVTATYCVPDTITYGETYTIGNDDGEYYSLEIKVPSQLTFDGFGTNANFKSSSKEYYFSSDNTDELVMPGIYYVHVYNNSSSVGEFTFTASELESIELDTPIIPEVLINEKYYFAFCAPESDTYEFDFTNSTCYAIEGNTISYAYYTREMEAGEWAIFYTESAAEVSVARYVNEITALTYNQTQKFNMNSGKQYTFSFMPGTTDMYKIAGTALHIRGIKIYTADKVLHENSGYAYGFSKTLELEAGVQIYISFTAASDFLDDNVADIAVLSPYTEIGETARIKMSTSEETIARFTAPNDGYYKISMIKQNDYSWYTITTTINGKTHYVSRNEESTQLVYLKKDESLLICFAAYQGYSTCYVNTSVKAVEVGALSAGSNYSITAGEYYSFESDTDCAYILECSNIVDDQGLNYISIFSGKSEYADCAIGERRHLFVGEAGVPTIICPTKNMQVSIAPAETKKIAPADRVSVGNEVAIFELTVTDEGLYGIENELCNTSFSMFYNNEWLDTAYEMNSFYNLDAGKYYIATVPQVDYEGISEPKASFKIAKQSNPENFSASVEGAEFYMLYGVPQVWVKVTAPYGGTGEGGVEVGVVCTAEDGTLITDYTYYANPGFAKNAYVKIPIGGTNLEKGDSCTVTPYVCVGDDKIYGEAKNVTFNVDSAQLRYNKEMIRFTGGNAYSPRTEYKTIEFIQPEGAESSTYIDVPEYLRLFDIYDEDMSYIAYSQENGRYCAKLTAGKKYYMILQTNCNAIAEVCVSSLESAPEESAYEITEVSTTGNTVSFEVSGYSMLGAQLYAAAYDSNGKMIELCAIKNPSGDNRITFTKDDLAYCKLFVTSESDAAPLCKSVKAEFNK